MDKNKATQIIISAAKKFDSDLRRQMFLIVFGAPSKPSCIEVRFPEKNFLHLTGVELNAEHLLRDIDDKSSNLNDVFYEKACNGSLQPNDFEMRADGTTRLKLEILSQAIDIARNARMIGDYNGNRPYLQSEKIAGGTRACIGLVSRDSYFVPNTILAANTRHEVHQYQRVLAILSRDFEGSYSSIKHMAKGIDAVELLKKIKQMHEIDGSLLPTESSQEQGITTQFTNIVHPQFQSLPRADALTFSDIPPQQKSILDRLRDFVGGIAAKIRQAFSSPAQQRPASKQRHSAAPAQRQTAERDKGTADHADRANQDRAHGEPQQAAARTAHTISHAKRSDIKAQAQRAGHTDKAHHRGAQTHSHDDELS